MAGSFRNIFEFTCFDQAVALKNLSKVRRRLFSIFTPHHHKGVHGLKEGSCDLAADPRFRTVFLKHVLTIVLIFKIINLFIKGLSILL
ncbi:MAG: hypothetical protein PUA61_06775 [Succinatimonas hippei]|nr:hypothetical protein [Succinatimonas hippei]